MNTDNKKIEYDPFTDPNALIFTILIENNNKEFCLETNKRYKYNYNIYSKSLNENMVVEYLEHEIKNNTGDIELNFSSIGIKKIAVTGDIPAMFFLGIQIIGVDQWGTTKWESMEDAFFSCAILKYITETPPDLSKCINLEYMFFYCDDFNIDISNWDVSNVKNMSKMFKSCKNFKQDLNKWNVQKDANVLEMFKNSGLDEDEPEWYKNR